jgi:hypothetical protein
MGNLFFEYSLLNSESFFQPKDLYFQASLNFNIIKHYVTSVFKNLRSLIRRENLPCCSASFFKAVIGHSNDMLFGGRTHRRHVIGMTDDLRYMVTVWPFLQTVKL